MRVSFAILSLPLLSLAACGGGGGGAATLGSIAPPTSVIGSGSATAGTTTASASFLDVGTATTFDAVGGMQSLDVTAKGASLYQGNASTVATPSGTIAYNPRDGIFTVTLNDPLAGISRTDRFQDPAHRTDFLPSSSPQPEVPNFANFNYLESAAGTDANNQPLTDVFFYQRPGTTTSYVSLAGFVHRSSYDSTTGAYHGEHGVFVFGSKTSPLQIPTKGGGHFDGDFIATMVSTGSFDKGGTQTPLQWINGTSSVDVDFAKMSVALGLTGVVGKAYVNDVAVNDLALNTPSGTVFSASGTATLNTLRSGFAGKFLTAYFANGSVKTAIDFAPISANSSTAGASSIDGAFYGPDAVNLGGNFRIVGGVPDQRVDILGAFTGAKK